MARKHKKLTDQEVREIYALKGKHTQVLVAKWYGVSACYVSDIQAGHARREALASGPIVRPTFEHLWLRECRADGLTRAVPNWPALLQEYTREQLASFTLDTLWDLVPFTEVTHIDPLPSILALHYDDAAPLPFEMPDLEGVQS